MDRPKPNAPIWVKLFVAFHMVAIVSWSLPNAPRGVQLGTTPAVGSEHLLLANERTVKQTPAVRTYLLTTGFWQVWDMFAPDPASRDFWGDAEVVRQSGAVERFPYPRMYTLPIPQKYPMERYRKFFERAGSDSFSYVWPQFAYRIAMKADTDPLDRPVQVRLYRHWMDVPKIGNPLPPDYRTAMYWTEYIDLERLDQEKAK